MLPGDQITRYVVKTLQTAFWGLSTLGHRCIVMSLGTYHVQAIVAMLKKIYRSDKLPLIQYHVLQ
jgi:hypothetical protein